MSRKTKFRAPSLPKEQKLLIALDYVNNDLTLQETADKYGLSNYQLVWSWVKKFGLKEKMLSNDYFCTRKTNDNLFSVIVNFYRNMSTQLV